MPTYEYECEQCGIRFEVFQSITEPPRKRCPECRCKVRRLPGTGAGLLFKGSGFYETDYRSSDYKQAAKAEKKDNTSRPDSAKKPGGKATDATKK